MQTQETKQTYGIKGKLISAVAMLLVAIIMVVSSTYAWFTLSTAPEVTGISTAVGANGALEMLLLTQDATGNWVYNDGLVDGKTVTEKNTYWGNLVDVSTGYGLDNIVLYPSQLSLDNTGAIKPGVVEFPIYGADGRVSELSDGAVTGIYETVNNTAAFYPGNGYGVRAVGSSSGMTARQLAYRNALSSAGTNMAQAKRDAATALSTNGNAIADIAIRKGTAESGDGAYTQKDIKNLVALTSDLTDIVEQMEESYKQFIIAYAASAAINEESDSADVKLVKESLYSNVQAWFAENDTDSTKDNTIYTFADTTKGFAAETNLGVTISLPTQVATGIAKLATTKANVAAAHTGLTDVYDDTAAEDTAVQWTQFNTYLHKLVDINGITVSGWKVEDILQNKDAFADAAMKQFAAGGIVLEIKTGGGVLADIADQCGDYEAKITIKEITYGVSIKDVPAHMKAKTDKAITNCADTYLGDIKTAVNAAGAPANDGAQQMPISEFYGYIVDLAFRTNAAESNLLLQTAPKDRIYSDNAENELTWGKGSTMTFKATAADFTDQDVKDLMEHINIVFFTPGKTANDNNTILAYAKLDVANATVSAAEGVTADIYLCEMVDAYKCTLADNSTVTLYKVVTPAVADDPSTDENETAAEVVTYYEDYEHTKVYTVPADATVDTTATKVVHWLKEDDAVIKKLTQNTAENVSVLVYLDGSTITNADVAATVATSMTGSMNLQFASSATLDPMDYEEFKNPANNNQGGTQNP